MEMREVYTDEVWPCYMCNAFQTYKVNVEETVANVSLELREETRPREPSRM